LTTARQIKAIFARLLERNEDLVLIDRVLVLKPVRHFARAIFIDRTSSADTFQPQTALLVLFVGYEHRPLIVGEWLYRKETSGSKRWLWSDPFMPQDFIRIVEQDALPRLRAVRAPEDYLRYAEEVYEHHFPFYWGLRLSLCVTLGRFDEARDIMNDRRWSKISASFFNKEIEGLGDRLKEQGSAVSREDKKALVSILHEREARSVEKLKLSAVWERTPFPIELEISAISS
jgi:hypothetical protein